MRGLLKKRFRIILVLSAIALVAIVALARRDTGPRYEVAEAKIADLVQEVAVTGRVKPADTVALTFEIAGKAARVFFNVGEKVQKGQTLVRLNDAELQAELAQAKANLEVEVAVLGERERGTRVEEIEAAESNLENVEAKAAADIEEAYAAALASMQQGAQAAKSSLLVLTDIQFVHFLGNDQNSGNLRDAKGDAIFALFAKKDAGGLNNESLGALESGVFGEIQTLKSQERQATDAALANVLVALGKTRDALKAVPLTSEVTSAQKANLAVEKAAIDNEIVTLSAKQQAIAVQKAQNASAISSAKEDLRLKKAGSTPEAIVSQQARVKSAQAAVQTVQAKLAKTQLVSPLKGVVTKQEAKVGEFVKAGDIVVSVISENEFEIETNVPEADIAKVDIEDAASLTLDAYGESVVFEASVVAVDPAETIIEGVPTYKTTLHFFDEDSRIRSGMTANITIVTAEKKQVLVVPSRAVIEKDDKRIVRVLNKGNRVEEREVATGLRGSDGNVEIQQGLKEGEMVVTFVYD